MLNIKARIYYRIHPEGVLNLKAKTITYFVKYYKEHVRYADHEFFRKRMTKIQRSQYLERFFNRIRDRLSKKEKKSLSYLKIWLLKYFKLYVYI